MARIELDVEHTLPPDSALARIQALGEYYEHRHHAHVTWRDTAGEIQVKYVGIKLVVNVRVEPHRVHCSAPDPGFLLRKRGTEYLRKKIARYLDPLTPLEALPRT